MFAFIIIIGPSFNGLGKFYRVQTAGAVDSGKEFLNTAIGVAGIVNRRPAKRFLEGLNKFLG